MSISSTTLNFGKYKNEILDDSLISTDEQYFRWLLKSEYVKKHPSVKDFVKSYFSNPEYVLKFGKYQNKTAAYIKSEDEKYFQWLVSNSIIA